jgi:hypothetical protein
MSEATTSKITELGLYTTMLLAMDTEENHPLGTSFLIQIALTLLRNKTIQNKIL